MKQWQLQAFGLDALRLRDVPPPPPPERGEVTVRMLAVSLNYRDIMSVEGSYNPKQSHPLVPLSDGAGVVTAVGTDVSTLQVGDRVAGIFSQTWLEGVPEFIPRGGSLGGAIPGVAQEYRNFPESGLVSLPEHLTPAEGSTLPCAAVTAWHALFERGKVVPGAKILLQGTGGVSLFSLQLAKAAGAETIHLTSSPTKAGLLERLGADRTISYRDTPDWHRLVLELTGGRGVDHVVDVGGPETLSKAISSTRHGGRISLIGVLSGGQAKLDLLSAIARNIQLDAIFVGSRAMFLRLNQALAHHQIKPVVDSVYPFDALPEALAAMRERQHAGKIVLEL